MVDWDFVWKERRSNTDVGVLDDCHCEVGCVSAVRGLATDFPREACGDVPKRCVVTQFCTIHKILAQQKNCFTVKWDMSGCFCFCVAHKSAHKTKLPSFGSVGPECRRSEGIAFLTNTGKQFHNAVRQSQTFAIEKFLIPRTCVI